MPRGNKRDTRTLLEIARGVGEITKPARTTKVSKRELNPLETHEQGFLLQQLALLEPKYPELALVYAVPNGGHRSVKVAAQMKREGVKRSVPDLVLPVPRYPFDGLYVEMKRIGYYSTPAQVKFQKQLREQGYAVVEAQGSDLAYAVFLGYLKLPAWPAEPLRQITQEEWHRLYMGGFEVDSSG